VHGISPPAARALWSGTVGRLLLALLISTTLARLTLAWLCPGFVGGDDVEMLEAAFRSARGLDFAPWEIRNLLVPVVLVAPALRVAGLLGAHDPASLVLVGRLPFVALASLNVLLLFLLARRLRLAENQSLAAAGLYALHWLPLGYGATTYPRTVAVACLLGAALLVCEEHVRPWRLLGAGSLVAVAFACRYSEVIYLLPVALLAATANPRRPLRPALLVVLGFGAGALVTVGIVDWLTWGQPFCSLASFARYTLAEGASSSRLVSQPPWWYLQRLPFWLPLTLLPGLALTMRRRQWWPLWAWVLLPLLALSAIHHKELRYLQGVLPPLMLLAVAGLSSLRRLVRPAVVVTLSVASILWGVLGLRFLTRTTGAAVEAAQHMVAAGTGETIVLSQAWAYGHRLLFGNGVGVRDVATPPSVGELAMAIPGAGWVALYSSDLRANQALATLLRESGFEETGRFTWVRSRAVVVWRRRPPTEASGRTGSALPPPQGPPRSPAST
jgi:GPI mannosyltransferase 3